jgi:hypothetical protein
MNFTFKKAKQQPKNEKLKDYFDEDDDDDDDSSFPATSSGAEEEEVDPLDAFMNENTVQLHTEELRPRDSAADLPEIVSGHGQDDADEEEREERGAPAALDYDSDGVPLGTKRGGGGVGEKVVVEALPPLDHSLFHYPPFRKVFSAAAPLSPATADDEANTKRRRAELQVRVSGSGHIPAPAASFEALRGLPPPLLAEIARLGFEAPTPIQAQAIPAVLAGDD